MTKKKALGRGLGALLEDAKYEKKSFAIDNINEIEIENIVPNPFQPRTTFNADNLNDLAASIEKLGIIQPITVCKTEDDNYMLISGERRYRAAQIAGLTAIPAFIRQADDQGLLEMALVENIQREDLNAIEIAISYKRLIEECNLTQEDLSLRVGKNRATIANYIRLLNLPAEIQIGIRDEKISMGHARCLLNVPDPETQINIFFKIVNEQLSVRKTEEFTKISSGEIETKKRRKVEKKQQEEYKDLKNHLSTHFNTNIELSRNQNGRGKIVIAFKSDEDLERIIGIIDKMQ